MTIHAWFAADVALREGSWLYQKPDGTTVNVTRVDAKGPTDRWGKPEEIYVGEVLRAEDGGRLTPRTRVVGITD